MDKFDVTAKIFEFAEDFFLLVSIACLKILAEMMERLGIDDSIDIADATKPDENLLALVYFIMYYVGPYWAARGAVKSAMSTKVAELWRYFIHIFIATRKVRYTRLSIRYLWVIRYLHPDLSQTLSEHRFMNLTGDSSSSIALDMFIEKVTFAFFMIYLCVTLY